MNDKIVAGAFGLLVGACVFGGSDSLLAGLVATIFGFFVGLLEIARLEYKDTARGQNGNRWYIE